MNSFIGEDRLITAGSVTVYAGNPAEAFDLALNILDRFAALTDRIASIETYTITLLPGSTYRIEFS